MSPDKIIRAWKDPEFRANLTTEEKAQLPSHPAGEISLSDTELDQTNAAQHVAGGTYFSACSLGQRCINSRAGAWTCGGA